MNKEEWIARVKNDWQFLHSCPKVIKNDIDIVSAAVAQNGMAISFASETLQDNKELAKLAMRTSDVLDYLSPRLKEDPELVMSSIIVNPTSILYAGPGLKTNKEFLFNAYLQNPEILKYISSPQLLREPIEAQIKLRAEKPNSYTTQICNAINASNANWELIKRAAGKIGIPIPPNLKGGKKSRKKCKNKRKSRRYK